MERTHKERFIIHDYFLPAKQSTSKSQFICYYQGRHSNQCHRAMALVVFCLASKPCFKNLPRNYNTLKYMAKKPRGLEVALVDFRPDWRHCV